MAGNKLSGRIEALELAADPHLSGPVVIVVDPAETDEQARSRWEATNGPIESRRNVLLIETGVPRSMEGVCA